MKFALRINKYKYLYDDTPSVNKIMVLLFYLVYLLSIIYNIIILFFLYEYIIKIYFAIMNYSLYFP